MLLCTAEHTQIFPVDLGVPMHPYGNICQSAGVHLRLSTEWKSTFIYYLFLNIVHVSMNSIF